MHAYTHAHTHTSCTRKFRNKDARLQKHIEIFSKDHAVQKNKKLAVIHTGLHGLMHVYNTKHRAHAKCSKPNYSDNFRPYEWKLDTYLDSACWHACLTKGRACCKHTQSAHTYTHAYTRKHTQTHSVTHTQIAYLIQYSTTHVCKDICVYFAVTMLSKKQEACSDSASFAWKDACKKNTPSCTRANAQNKIALIISVHMTRNLIHVWTVHAGMCVSRKGRAAAGIHAFIAQGLGTK